MKQNAFFFRSVHLDASGNNSTESLQSYKSANISVIHKPQRSQGFLFQCALFFVLPHTTSRPRKPAHASQRHFVVSKLNNHKPFNPLAFFTTLYAKIEYRILWEIWQLPVCSIEAQETWFRQNTKSMAARRNIVRGCRRCNQGQSKGLKEGEERKGRIKSTGIGTQSR